MRIASFTPAATELLFELGVGEDLVGVSHDCDHPAAALFLPRLTRGYPPELDFDALNDLSPDLIVAEARSPLPGVSDDELRTRAEDLDSQPMVIVLDPRTVGEVLDGARTIAQATDTKDAAVDLVRELSDRIDRVRVAVRRLRRPRVVALERLDPPRAAGYWTPQLIHYAGGEDVLGFAGEEPQELGWPVVAASQPDIVLVTPTGLSAELAHREAEMHRGQLASLGAREVIAVESVYFSRPGPRIVDGLELLAELLHPERNPPNPSYAGRALTVEI
ncbi:MAG: ABC transporter substrate-binding protein [Solirubrobacteraceae bacterium]